MIAMVRIKIPFVILLLILLATPAIAEFDDIDVSANGYNWVDMSVSEKEVFMALLYSDLGLGTDKQMYPEKTTIKKVDGYYSLAKNKTADEQNKYLRIPVVVVIGWITECKIEILDEHENVKKVIHEPKN